MSPCHTCKHVPGLFRLSSLLLQVLAFVFLVPRWFTVFGGWALLSSLLVLYGTYRTHDESMKSVVSAERTYWIDDRRCLTSALDERGSLG